MKVEIWSDVVCPWCYVGKRRFEAALARFEHRDQVQVEWKSFELDRSATSVTTSGSYAERLSAKYGTDVAKAQEMLDQMTATAAVEGLDFHFERAVHAGTFDAHQVIHLAGLRGLQDAVKERLMLAYFTQGRDVGDRDELVSLAVEAGLDADEVRDALAAQTHATSVRADEAQAEAFGITGVPFFVVDRKYGVSGAQPADALLQVLERAWAEQQPTLVMAGASSAGADSGVASSAGTGSAGTGSADAGSADVACGPDGCAI